MLLLAVGICPYEMVQDIVGKVLNVGIDMVDSY
jgi:hypothetical protein